MWIALDRDRSQQRRGRVHRRFAPLGRELRPTPFRKGHEIKSTSSDLQQIPDIDAERGKYDIRWWEMEPGDCLVFHAMIVHGAPGNDTPGARRRGLSLRYTGDDARYDPRPGTFQFRTSRNSSAGAPMTCDLFPRVWPRGLRPLPSPHQTRLAHDPSVAQAPPLPPCSRPRLPRPLPPCRWHAPCFQWLSSLIAVIAATSLRVRYPRAGRKTTWIRKRHWAGACTTRLFVPDFERIALLLQGGGALGSYQAGVYQALAEADLHPDWVAGISIGAINAALIAGNPPESRRRALRQFWEAITEPPFGLAAWSRPARRDRLQDDLAHSCVNQTRAFATLLGGAPGFFTPRLLPPFLSAGRQHRGRKLLRHRAAEGDAGAAGRFRPHQAGAMRFSVGAVNVRTGNFDYFDTTDRTSSARAHHGERRAAARLSGDRDRRRALLGRRPRLQHAAAMGARQPRRARTRWPSRSICGARAASCRAT